MLSVWGGGGGQELKQSGWLYAVVRARQDVEISDVVALPAVMTGTRHCLTTPKQTPLHSHLHPDSELKQPWWCIDSVGEGTVA